MANNLENHIPIIPTCNDLEDIIKVKKAIEISGKYNLPEKCIISGLGPDTNIALGYDKNPGKENLDYHENAHKPILDNTNWMIGVDIKSRNSIENILNTFPPGTKGKYILISYPLHLIRFKRIIKDAKKANKISKEVEIKFSPTKQRLRWIPYEILSTIKYFRIGKKRYFGN